MVRIFTGLRFGLLVGIGGGTPNLKKGVDIRLGDVVVSQPTGTTGGIIQYDKGKVPEGGTLILSVVGVIFTRDGLWESKHPNGGASRFFPFSKLY